MTTPACEVKVQPDARVEQPPRGRKPLAQAVKSLLAQRAISAQRQGVHGSSNARCQPAAATQETSKRGKARERRSRVIPLAV
jgi:hypothetical protein